MGQCLTSSRAETSKTKFCVPYWDRNDLFFSFLSGKKLEKLDYSLIISVKRLYYSDLSDKTITDNKTFRKTVKPFLTNKTIESNKKALVEKGEIITNGRKIEEL